MGGAISRRDFLKAAAGFGAGLAVPIPAFANTKKFDSIDTLVGTDKMIEVLKNAQGVNDYDFFIGENDNFRLEAKIGEYRVTYRGNTNNSLGEFDVDLGNKHWTFETKGEEIAKFEGRESNVTEFINFDPLECASFVDNTTGLTFEVYGDIDGLDITTLEVRIDNKLRKVFVRPRILRSE